MIIEGFLHQLGYIVTDSLKVQMKQIIDNTKEFDKIEKHIFDLHDHIKHTNSYVALSSTHDYLKIKIESPSDEQKEKALKLIQHFSKKYKVELEKVANKDTFYIIGFKQIND
jgi:hypothetical protein